MNKAAKTAVFMINFYRNCLRQFKLPSCKYYPSCSAYAVACFKNQGFFKAIFLVAWRILRCNPFSKGGFDPAPPAEINL